MTSGLITNFYPNNDKIDSWISRGSIFLKDYAHSAFIVRYHMDFKYLFFISNSLKQLEIDLVNFLHAIDIDIVTEIVGTQDSNISQIELFQQHGFCLHEILVRMQTIKNEIISKSEYADEVENAQIKDSKRIQNFLINRLDKYSEQIPDIPEIETLINNKSILIIRKQDSIGGLLIYENTGILSHLREWHVNKDYRNEKIGSKLIKSYFNLSRECKRFILWVKNENLDAINRYKHYGYKEDKLIDQILVKRKLKT